MVFSDIIPLQHNESYWLLDEELREAYSGMGSRQFSTYPDYTELRTALATYAGVSPDHVLTTAGSDSAIRMLAEIYGKDGKRVLLPVPTFYGYERIFQVVGITSQTVCYTEQDARFIFPTEETIRAIEQGAEVVFLCQPNNPLGCRIPQSDLDRILDAARDREATVVFDEAYFEFAGTTSLGRIGSQPLIILRTLSKAFGLAGARVGYCIAAPETIRVLQDRFLPWPIAHPSVYAALEGLKRVPLIRTRIDLVIEARDQFMNKLRSIESITLFESVTNFILMRVPDSLKMKALLEQEGILVARGDSMSSIPEAAQLLRSTIRASVPSPEHMSRVLSTLSEAANITRQ